MIPKKVIESIEGYRITIHDRTKSKEYSLQEIFAVNQDNLIDEFAQQASTYAYFASLQVMADNNSDICKLGLEQERAAADIDARAEMEKDGKKYTEAVIKGAIDLDEEVSKLSSARLGFEYDSKLLKAICNALEMRANMLVAMGAMLRHELGQIDLHNREKNLDKSVKELDKVLSKKG